MVARALQLKQHGSRNTKVIMVAYEYTYHHEYIIRTKHELCDMAFLPQAAHKIAVSCHKTLIFIVSCSGK